MSGFPRPSGLTQLSGPVSTPGAGSGVTTINQQSIFFSNTALVANTPVALNVTGLSLAVGTWLVVFNATVAASASGTASMAINNASGGTGVGTFSGASQMPAADIIATFDTQILLMFRVIVTTAGTFVPLVTPNATAAGLILGNTSGGGYALQVS